MSPRKEKTPKDVEVLRHDDAKRRNIQTAESDVSVEAGAQAPVGAATHVP